MSDPKTKQKQAGKSPVGKPPVATAAKKAALNKAKLAPEGPMGVKKKTTAKTAKPEKKAPAKKDRIPIPNLGKISPRDHAVGAARKGSAIKPGKASASPQPEQSGSSGAGNVLKRTGSIVLGALAGLGGSALAIYGLGEGLNFMLNGIASDAVRALTVGSASLTLGVSGLVVMVRNVFGQKKAPEPQAPAAKEAQ